MLVADKMEVFTSFIGEILPLSHEVKKGPLCFLHFSERSLGAPGSKPSPRLQQCMSKSLCIGVIECTFFKVILKQ